MKRKKKSVTFTALFVSVLMFFGKWVIFQRTFFGKLSNFLMLHNDVENGLEIVF